MLSCSQDSSLDWGASGSLPLLRRESARFFGELKEYRATSACGTEPISDVPGRKDPSLR